MARLFVIKPFENGETKPPRISHTSVKHIISGGAKVQIYRTQSHHNILAKFGQQGKTPNPYIVQQMQQFSFRLPAGTTIAEQMAAVKSKGADSTGER